MASAGAGAVLAGETHRGRRWLHSVGVIDGPDREPPAVEVDVERAVLASDHMGRRVPWRLAVPTGETAATVVCLHGRGQNEGFAFDAIGVHRFVAAAGLPWAVVAADGGDASYWHERADGSDAQAMLFDELLPLVRVRLDTGPVALLGWSMGGYGALLAAASRRDDVAAVAAASPALWSRYAEAAPGSFDDDQDFAAHDVFRRIDALRGLPVRLDCGDDDPFAGATRRLATSLPKAEYETGAGFHDAGYWRSRVPAQLAFFGRTLRRGAPS